MLIACNCSLCTLWGSGNTRDWQLRTLTSRLQVNNPFWFILRSAMSLTFKKENTTGLYNIIIFLLYRRESGFFFLLLIWFRQGVCTHYKWMVLKGLDVWLWTRYVCHVCVCVYGGVLWLCCAVAVATPLPSKWDSNISMHTVFNRLSESEYIIHKA